MTKSRAELPEEMYFDQFHNAHTHDFQDHAFPIEAYQKPMSWHGKKAFASGGSVIDQLKRPRNADIVSRALMLSSKKA